MKNVRTKRILTTLLAISMAFSLFPLNIFAAAPPPVYVIAVQDDGNGVAFANKTSAEAGTSVTITATPISGYTFKEWQVVSGGVTISPNVTANPATFNMLAGDVVVKAVFEAYTWDDGSPIEPPPNTGAETGQYRNLFVELGVAEEAEVTTRINRDWHRIFGCANSSCSINGCNQTTVSGTDNTTPAPHNHAFKLYYEVNAAGTIVPTGSGIKGYIVDAGNSDVRSEGMSYGLMMAVQMNEKAIFDKLWRWTYEHMYHGQGNTQRKGYFAWQVSTSGNIMDGNSAPDGEIFFATALMFASARWGDGAGIYNYGRYGRLVVHDLINRQGLTGDANRSLVCRENKMPRMGPMGEQHNHTNYSYHLPQFFDIWAEEIEFGVDNGLYSGIWNSDAAALADAQFWREAAEVSRNYFHNLLKNPSQSGFSSVGLAPEYSNWDGSGRTGTGAQGSRIGLWVDAWRVAGIIAQDEAWWGKNTDFAIRHAATMQNHLSLPAQNTRAPGRSLNNFTYPSAFLLDGTPQPDLAPDTSIGFVGNNAVASLSSSLSSVEAERDLAKEFVTHFWNASSTQGRWRYYDGALSFFSLLTLSGNYRAYFSTGANTGSTAVTNSRISLPRAEFDRANAENLDVPVSWNGNTLTSITNGSDILVENTHYVVQSPGGVRLNSNYLMTLPLGATSLTFTFSAGSARSLVIDVDDTSMSILGYTFENSINVLSTPQGHSQIATATFPGGNPPVMRVTKIGGHSANGVIVPFRLVGQNLSAYPNLHIRMRRVSGGGNSDFRVEVSNNPTTQTFNTLGTNTQIGNISNQNFGALSDSAFVDITIPITGGSRTGNIQIAIGRMGSDAHAYDIEYIGLIPRDQFVSPIANSSISPASVNFNKDAPANIPVNLTLNGNTLTSIRNGGVTLVTGTNYTVSGSTVTLNQTYLNTLPLGAATLTFTFSAGVSRNLIINVSNDQNPYIPGTGTLVYNIPDFGGLRIAAGEWLETDSVDGQPQYGLQVMAWIDSAAVISGSALNITGGNATGKGVQITNGYANNYYRTDGTAFSPVVGRSYRVSVEASTVSGNGTLTINPVNHDGASDTFSITDTKNQFQLTWTQISRADNENNLQILADVNFIIHSIRIYDVTGGVIAPDCTICNDAGCPVCSYVAPGPLAYNIPGFNDLQFVNNEGGNTGRLEWLVTAVGSQQPQFGLQAMGNWGNTVESTAGISGSVLQVTGAAGNKGIQITNGIANDYFRTAGVAFSASVGRTYRVVLEASSASSTGTLTINPDNHQALTNIDKEFELTAARKTFELTWTQVAHEHNNLQIWANVNFNIYNIRIYDVTVGDPPVVCNTCAENPCVCPAPVGELVYNVPSFNGRGLIDSGQFVERLGIQRMNWADGHLGLNFIGCTFSVTGSTLTVVNPTSANARGIQFTQHHTEDQRFQGTTGRTYRVFIDASAASTPGILNIVPDNHPGLSGNTNLALPAARTTFEYQWTQVANEHNNLQISSNVDFVVHSVRIYDVTATITNSSLSPTSASFDKGAPTTVSTVMTLNGNTFTGIIGLTLDNEYERSGDTITFKELYLQGLDLDLTHLTFVFSQGANQTFSIDVSDSSVVLPIVTFNSNGGGVVDPPYKQVRHNGTLAAFPANPTPPSATPDYTFAGWFDAQTGGNQVFAGNPLIDIDLAAEVTAGLGAGRANNLGRSGSPTITHSPATGLSIETASTDNWHTVDLYAEHIPNGTYTLSVDFNVSSGSAVFQIARVGGDHNPIAASPSAAASATVTREVIVQNGLFATETVGSASGVERERIRLRRSTGGNFNITSITLTPQGGAGTVFTGDTTVWAQWVEPSALILSHSTFSAGEPIVEFTGTQVSANYPGGGILGINKTQSYGGITVGPVFTFNLGDTTLSEYSKLYIEIRGLTGDFTGGKTFQAGVFNANDPIPTSITANLVNTSRNPGFPTTLQMIELDLLTTRPNLTGEIKIAFGLNNTNPYTFELSYIGLVPRANGASAPLTFDMSNFNMIAPFNAQTSPQAPTMFAGNVYANGTPITIRNVSGVTQAFANSAPAVPLFGGVSVSNARIFGGFRDSDYTGNTNITVEAGAVLNSWVYGGGDGASGSSAIVTGNTRIEIKGGSQVGAVFGGGNWSTVTGNTEIIITNSVIKYDVAGGGHAAGAAVSGNVSITLTDSTITDGKLFGGGMSAAVAGNVTVAINGTSAIPAVFGGGLGTAALVGGNAIVNIITCTTTVDFITHEGSRGAAVGAESKVNPTGCGDCAACNIIIGCGDCALPECPHCNPMTGVMIISTCPALDGKVTVEIIENISEVTLEDSSTETVTDLGQLSLNVEIAADVKPASSVNNFFGAILNFLLNRQAP
jgi:endo-1,4-beta-D-glucanase Y